jgi:predicted 3-demethylubiquinone-9 3-methyltransferase (glyoxalase superfamily)
MPRISPCLWFRDGAEEAVEFYVSLLPDSHIDHVQRNLADGLAGKEGEVLAIVFTLAGQSYQALNGNPRFDFTHAVSLSVECEGQAEVDRLWDRLSDGGEPVACGWVKDRYGVSWQIVPKILLEYLADPDREKAIRVMRAMMDMVKLDIAGLQAAYEGRDRKLQ